MRKPLIKSIPFALALLFTVQIFATNIQALTDTTVSEPSNSTVFALSGLKLRLAPALNAEVITVIDFGEAVTVLKTLDDQLYTPPEIEWTAGSWALVNYDGMTGYVYDGFISRLPFPSPRLTNESFGLANLLDEYVAQHLNPEIKPDTIKYHVEMDRHYHIKIKHYLNDGIRYNRHLFLEKEKATLTIPNIRITDAYQFVRSLLIGYDKGAEILNGVLFKQDANGDIYEISDRYRKNLIIKSYDGANVSIIVQDFAELGC
jgi:hypothetical protein